MADLVSIETPTHGRVLVERSTASTPRGWIVTLHGYGHAAEDALANAESLPGASDWHIAAVQGLHRFYARKEERIVASWMTRQDREIAIADNIEYVNRTIESLSRGAAGAGALIFIGFSQGAAMAYRAAMFGRARATGVIALGGDIPPDVTTVRDRPWPPVLIGGGAADPWYTAARVDVDSATLTAAGVTHEVVRYNGGHEWTDEFSAAAGRWIGTLTTS